MKTPEKPVIMNSLLWSNNSSSNSNNSNDDDDSITSTVSVEHPPKFPEEPLSPSSSCLSLSSSSSSSSLSASSSLNHPRPSLRVRINENNNLCYANSLYDAEECAAFWYTGEDYIHFKSAVSFMAKMIDRAEGVGGGMMLNHNHYDPPPPPPPKDPLSYTGILESAYHSCCQVAAASLESSQHPATPISAGLTKAQEAHLKQLFSMEIGLGRLGLERRSVRSVSKDKSRRRSDLLELVENAAALPSDEELGRQCEAITLASRLFARVIAQAQFLSTPLPSSSEGTTGTSSPNNPYDHHNIAGVFCPQY